MPTLEAARHTDDNTAIEGGKQVPRDTSQPITQPGSIVHFAERGPSAAALVSGTTACFRASTRARSAFFRSSSDAVEKKVEKC